MRTIAIIQARLGSTRLPGKVMLPFAGNHTALSYMLERVKKAKLIDDIIVATADTPEDRRFAEYLETLGVKYFVGSETDVLDRYYQAASSHNFKAIDVVVRLTGDCPFIDPKVIDKVISAYQSGGYDFVSNSLSPYTFPDGMDVEVFSFKNLERAAREAVLPSHREHVTFYFWKNPQKFKIHYFKNSTDLSGFRLTLDYPEDYELLKRVAQAFAEKNHMDFSLEDIVSFLQTHPEIRKLNQNIGHNTGWQSSLQEDQKFLTSNIKGKSI